MCIGFVTFGGVAVCAGGADWGLAEAVEEGSILGPTVLFTGGATPSIGTVPCVHCAGLTHRA